MCVVCIVFFSFVSTQLVNNTLQTGYPKLKFNFTRCACTFSTVCDHVWVFNRKWHFLYNRRRWLLPGTWSHLWFAGAIEVHRGALLLVSQWQCISSFVFYMFYNYRFIPSNYSTMSQKTNRRLLRLLRLVHHFKIGWNYLWNFLKLYSRYNEWHRDTCITIILRPNILDRSKETLHCTHSNKS